MNRHCGACTLCCKLLPVRALAKPRNTRCVHQSSSGCAVYHKAEFPPECGLWSCRWLVNPDTVALRRPDRSHYVVDIMPDLVRLRHNETGEVIELSVIQVWIDPAYPDAWSDPALLAYAEKEGEPLLIRYTRERMLFAVPPGLNSEGAWLIRASGDDGVSLYENASGSMLIDRLRGDLAPPNVPEPPK